MHVKPYLYFLTFLSIFILGSAQAEISPVILKIEHWSTKNGVPVYLLLKMKYLL